MLISFILNCTIVIMVVFSFAAMFTGWDFMGKEGKLQSPGMKMFRYFTIDSNVLMGICSLIMAIAQLQVLRGKTAELAPEIYAVKLMGTSAVMLTLLVTAVFLVPQFEQPMALYYNSNLFFHLLVPLAAAVSFLGAERTRSLSFPATLLGALPTVLYAIYYIAMIFTHLSEGEVDRKYDFYNFLNGKKKMAPLAGTIVILISYLISLLLWLCNRGL